MVGLCGGESCLLYDSQEAKREEEEDPWSQCPFQGHTPVTSLPPTRPHLLNVLPTPINATSWDQSFNTGPLRDTYLNHRTFKYLFKKCISLDVQAFIWVIFHSDKYVNIIRIFFFLLNFIHFIFVSIFSHFEAQPFFYIQASFGAC